MGEVYDAIDRDRARLAIIDAYDEYVRQARELGAEPNVPLFLSRYHRGGVPGTAAALRVVPTLHVATMYRWLARRDAGGRPGLSSRYGSRRGTGLLDNHPAMRARLVELSRIERRPGAAKIRMMLAAEFPGDRIPSVKTIQRFFADVTAAGTAV